MLNRQCYKSYIVKIKFIFLYLQVYNLKKRTSKGSVKTSWETPSALVETLTVSDEVTISLPPSARQANSYANMMQFIYVIPDQ
jgi:hypothetical protein